MLDQDGGAKIAMNVIMAKQFCQTQLGGGDHKCGSYRPKTTILPESACVYQVLHNRTAGEHLNRQFRGPHRFQFETRRSSHR